MAQFRTTSFTIDDDTEAKLAELQTDLNKSQVIRRAIHQMHQEKTMQTASIDTLAKAESQVESFFNKATAEADDNWVTVKHQAADILNKYSELRFPTLTPQAAMAKAAFEQDTVTKILYALVNIKSDVEFAHLKAGLGGGA